MKKLFVATMMLVSGVAFGQQEQTTIKSEETQPVTTKTDVSSEESKTVKSKDLKSLEGKSYKIKLTSRKASGKKTASPTDATSQVNPGKAGEVNLQNNAANVQSPATIPAEGQAVSPAQPVTTSTVKETEVKSGEVNPANSSATTPVPATTPSGQQETAGQNVNANQTDKNLAEQQTTGTAQPDLSQNQITGTATTTPASPGTGEETNKAAEQQTAVAAPVIEKSYENKTLIITLKDGTVNISADDMQFESCPYQVTSGTGSLITFTASCTGANPAEQIWLSGLVDGTTIRGSLLTKAPVGGESTDYTFKGAKTNAPKKRADQKETSLR